MGRQDIIELNGKKYDARTGALLGESRVKATASKRLVSQRGRVIDGFIKKKPDMGATIIQPSMTSSSAQKHSATPATKPLDKATKIAPKNMDIRRPATKPATSSHQKTERPKTLMRHAVKKPQVTIKPSMKTVNPAEIMAAPKGTIAKSLEKKLSVANVNPFRLARARHVAKSHHIQRFEKNRHPIPHTAAATQASVPSLAHTSAIRPAQYTTARGTRRDYRNNTATPQIVTTQAPTSFPVAVKAVAAPATRPAVEKQPVDIFEAALAHATSHEEKTPSHARFRSSRRHRLVNIMAGVGAFLLIGGFTAYMNMTNIELRLASMHAGFQVHMPSYKPTGYTLEGGIETKDKRVALNFRSGDRIFTVTQEASEWNSSTLLDQTASERGEPSQAIQAKGRTIYIYDDSNATWVNGGIRYQVSGNAPLNADELVSLATSM